MKLINQSYEIIEPKDYSVKELMKFMEKCGRISYQSFDKIDDFSYIKFHTMILSNGHNAVLEFMPIYLTITEYNPETEYLIKKFEENEYSKVVKLTNTEKFICYITTTMRVITENYFKDCERYFSDPTEYHERRYTVKFITNRQITHELVRHRKMSFIQESTRFCNYNKDKFGNELTFIKNGLEDNTEWCNYLVSVEKVYMKLINLEIKPQIAASVLPNAVKAEIAVSGYATDWKNLFALRTSKAAHPQMRELMIPLQQEFYSRGMLINNPH